MALKVGELFASFSIDSSSVGSAVAQIEQSCNSVGSSMMTSGAAMTAAITAPIIKAAKDMYNAGTDFDAQMSKVFAIRGLDKELEKDASAMEALRAKAIELGSSTEWTATQAGEALQYMAMAGWSTDAMLEGLTPVMHLASAAGADLGTTSDIVTDAMTAFGLTLENAKKSGHNFSDDVEHFTDVLAAAATNSNTNVELLGTSFRYVAPLAGTLGMSVDDVAVALGLMANNGIKSTTAGAALRNILTGLTGNTKKTAEACEALGLSLTDERGEMKSLSTVMGDLRGAYKQHNGEVDSMRNTLTKLDEKLAEGKISQKEYEEAVEAATAGSSDFLKQCVALAGKQGLSGLLAIMASSDDDFDALSKAIENCDGATDKMAATMLDNAKGAVTIFKSACEGLSITLWDLYKDKFQGIVEKATAMIQKFQKLDSKTQKTYMKFAALSAAAGPVLVIAGKLVKMLPKLAKAISALTSPMGLAVAALALFAVAAVDADNTIGRTMEDMANKAKDKLDAFSKTIDDKIGAVGDRMPALIESIIKSINTLVPKLFEVGTKIITGIMDAITKNADNLADLGTTIITTLVNGIADALPKIVPSAVNMIATLTAAIINNIPELAKAALKLIDGFKEAISNIDFADIGEKILTAISNAISGLDKVFTDWFTNSSETAKKQDWASIGTKVIELIMTATTKLAEFAGKMITNICDALNSHNWAENGSTLQKIAQALMDGIKDAIPKLADVAVNIVKAIASLFTKEGAVSQIATAATDIAKTLIDGIADILPTLTTALVDIVQAIGDGLAKADWAGAVGNLTTLGQAIINAAVQAIKGAGKLAVGVVEALGTLLQSVTSDESLSKNLDGFADMLVQGIIKGLDALGEVSVQLVQAIGNMLSKINWDNVVDTATTIANKLIDGIITGFQKLGEVSTNLVKAVGDWIAKIDWTKVSEHATKIANVLIDGIIAGIKSLGEVSSNLVTAIGDFIAKIDWTKVASAASSIAGAVIDGMIKGLEAIGEVSVQLVKAIGNMIGKIDWTKVADSATQIADVIIDGIIKGFNALTKVSTDLVTAIGDMLGKINWTDLGDSAGKIGEKIIEGIVAGLKGVVKLGSELANAIGEVFTKINWAEVGDAAMGLAQKLFDGIVEGAKTLVPDMTELITSIGKGIEAAAGALGTLAGNLVGNIVKFVLNPENWAKLLKLGESIVKGLATGIMNLGESILKGAVDFVLGVFNGLFEALGISGQPWSEETSQALDTVTTAVDRWGEEIETTLNDNVQWLANYPWEQKLTMENLERAMSNYENVIEYGTDELLASMKEYEWLGSEQITSLFKTLLDTSNTQADRAAAYIALKDLGFGQMVDNSMEGLDTELESEISSLGQTSEAAFIAAFESLGYVIPDSVKAGLSEGKISVEEAAKQIVDLASTANDQATAEATAKATGEGVTDELSAAENAGEANVTEATQNIVDESQLVLDTLPDYTEIIGDDAVEAMSDAIGNNNAATDAMDTLADDVVKAALEKMTYDTGYQTGFDYVDAMKKGIEDVDVKGAMEKVAKDADKAITDKLSEKTGKAAGKGYADALKGAISDAHDPIVTAAEKIGNDTKSKLELILSKDKGKKIGEDFMNGVRTGLDAPKSLIFELVKMIGNNCKILASSLMSNNMGQSIGLNFAYGIASGIGKGASNVVSAIVKLCRDAVAEAKKQLDINSPSRVARDEIGMMFDKGLVAGLNDGVNLVEKAAAGVSESMRDSFYIGDPSKGTVYTSQQQARQNASETAAATSKNESLLDKADRIGKAIANRLIESGVLESDIMMDGTAVGKKTAAPVSKEISRKSKQTVTGRSLQGVIA